MQSDEAAGCKRMNWEERQHHLAAQDLRRSETVPLNVRDNEEERQHHRAAQDTAKLCTEG